MAQWLDVSDTDPRVAYTVGASPQTAFVVPFLFFANSDLDVFVDGVQRTLNLHYTVTGAQNPTGGVVTFVAAQSNVSILIQRNVPIALDTHIPPSGPLDIPAINIQFSKLVAMIQQIQTLFGQVVGNTFISNFITTLLNDADAATARATLGINAKNRVGGEVIPRTIWIEMDGFQPGIIVRETPAGLVSFRKAYLTEKLTALHEQGYRRFIIGSITDLGRTYTTWLIATPVDPSGNVYDSWFDHVSPLVQGNVDNFDVVAHIFDVCDGLDGAQVVVGLGRHDDVNLLNDLADGGADPMRFGKTEGQRLSEEIARYTVEAADIFARFGARPAFRGFYITHESDHLASSVQLYRPIADVLAQYGEVHVSVSTPTDFADTNAIADVVNSFRADWLWAQTSAGVGYNWITGLQAYVSQLTIFGSSAHMATWRSLIERARGRTASATITVTIAAPAVVTWTAHGWANGTAIVFETTGSLPTGLTAGTPYYIKNAAANTFELATTPNGTSISTTGTQSGVHSGIVTARTPQLGVVVENWRIGTQGVGTLTFGATSGNGVTVTLGTSNSILASDVGKDINVRADQATGVARITATVGNPVTSVTVDITENLADVNIAAGFWALVPDQLDAVIDTYPALAEEATIEISTTGGYVDDVSIYSEVFWDPGTLSLRLKNSQAGRADFRNRAIDGWNDHAIFLSDAATAARFLAWNINNPVFPISVTTPLLLGSNASGGDLRLSSTSHATKGTVNIGNTTVGWFMDETNGRIAIGKEEYSMIIGGFTVPATFSVHTHNDTVYEAHVHSDTVGQGAVFNCGRSRGTESAQAVVQSGDKLGRFAALGYDGTDYEFGALIDFEVDGTPGSGDMPGRIVFMTTPDGSATPVEAARISANKEMKLSGNLALPNAAIVNWSSGDLTLTHSTNKLTLAGGNLAFPGTTTNDNAAAGEVGEVIEAEVLVGSAVALTNGVAANITSISLTAGDWDVCGNIVFDPAATTAVIANHAAINTVSATLPTLPGKGAYAIASGGGVADVTLSMPTGSRRISLSATTTVYLVAMSAFTTSTMAAYGFIWARRMR